MTSGSPIAWLRPAATGLRLALLVYACAGWGCGPHLLSFDTSGSQVLTTLGAPAIVDGRAEFRQTVCALARDIPSSLGAGPLDCGTILWRLDDEPGPRHRANPPELKVRLCVLIVPGAFQQCYPAFGMPFEDAANELNRQGHAIGFVSASGRGGADRNAAEIEQVVRSLDGSGPIVLVGYSKGAIDVLHFLVEYPEAAARVAAVVSISGPINGSPLADWLATAYDRILSGLPLPNCPPMDGGVLDSLQRSQRMSWLPAHPLPRHIRYFSLVTFTRRENVHPLMLYTYDLLAQLDPRNDGYVLWTDQVIPGSTLLGYVNLDHYDVALPVRERLNVGGQNSRGDIRRLLFGAVLITVAESLNRASGAGDPGLPSDVSRDSAGLPRGP